MRLLFFMQTIRARGAERVVSVLVKELASMGHQVSLICTGFESGEEFPLSEDIHLEFLAEEGRNRVSSFFMRIHYIRKKTKELHPDCIISLAGAKTLFMITLAQIGLSIPVIFSERHDPVHNPKSKLKRIMRLICYHACDRIVFQTKGAQDFFSNSISKKGRIIPNPIKEDLPKAIKNDSTPYIATFCALDAQKNLSLLLRAFSKLVLNHPDVRLVIYGDGELRDSLEFEAEQLGISSKVDFNHHSLEVHQLIRDCAMYVSSSDYEGQSNSMLEAMAMGLPCVCTDCPCGGARAVIEHGVNGLLVPVGDEEKLAEAMDYMLNHPEEARKMGNNAAKIREERKPNLIAQEWEKLIQETVSQ